MQELAELLAKAAELIKAEALVLKRHCFRLALIAAAAVVVVLLALTGLGFLLAGYYLLLARFFSHMSAALLVAASLFAVVAGVVFAFGYSSASRRARPTDAGVSAAATQLKQAIAQIDPLGPLRRRPVLTLIIAALAGAVAALSAETLGSMAALTRSVTGLLRPVAAFFSREFLDAFREGKAAAVPSDAGSDGASKDPSSANDAAAA